MFKKILFFLFILYEKKYWKKDKKKDSYYKIMVKN